MIGTFIDILLYSLGSLFWGILIGLACLLVFYLLVKGWWKDAEFSPFTYLTGGVLGLLLIFQCTLICGSLAIMNKADEFESLVTQVVQQMAATGYASLSDVVDEQESQEVMDQLVENHPILGNYVDWADFSGHTLAELPASMTETLKSYLKRYIVRRLLWSLAFVVVAAVIVNYTITKQRGSHGHSRYASGRLAADRGRLRSSRPMRSNIRRNRYR